MFRTRVFVTVSAGVLLAASAAGAAPAITITNAQIASRTVSGSLGATIDAVSRDATEPTWITWEVPANEAGARACCNRTIDGVTCSGCSLEKREGVSLGDREQRGKVSLEAPGHVVVFVRVDSGALQRVAAYASSCEVDAGGRSVVTVSGIKPAESVAWLAGLAGSAGQVERRIASGALVAMAFHAAPEADAALEALAMRSDAGKDAEDAVFWMGAARGRAGFEGVRRVLAKATTDTLRDRAVFALSVSKEADAVPVLLETARNGASAHVRGQAIFWLGQKAGSKVAGTLVEAVEQDPDTKVKTQALFALSQLPAAEGVPLLIQVARTNRNAAVKKQAMFWLGQSKDARALAFFEEVLTGGRTR